jgi:hypothetical protein
MKKLNVLEIVIIIVLILLIIAIIKFNYNKQKLLNISNRLWLEHTGFTREFILEAFNGNANARNAVVSALTQNQKDIGHFIGAYTSTEIGDNITKALLEHITIAADIVTILIPTNYDKNALNAKQVEWVKNGNDIADYLNQVLGINTRKCMQDHLTTTTNEVMSIRNGDFNRAVNDYYSIETVILDMSSKIMEGIVKRKWIQMIFWDKLPCCK